MPCVLNYEQAAVRTPGGAAVEGGDRRNSLSGATTPRGHRRNRSSGSAGELSPRPSRPAPPPPTSAGLLPRLDLLAKCGELDGSSACKPAISIVCPARWILGRRRFVPAPQPCHLCCAKLQSSNEERGNDLRMGKQHASLWTSVAYKVVFQH